MAKSPEFAYTLEEVVAALDASDDTWEITRSRSGRAHKVKTKEWPPRCPSGQCDVRKGCICQPRSSVAADYFDCVQQIYGDDAKGMPGQRPGVSSLDDEHFGLILTPKPMRKRRHQAYRLSEEVHRDTSLVLCSNEVDAPSRLLDLFADLPDPNLVANSVAVPPVDLCCYEKSFEGKRVTWAGLPPRPPEWLPGCARKVPRMWTPSKHVCIFRDSFPLLPETKGRVITAAVPPGVWLRA